MTTPAERAERELGLPGLVQALATGPAASVTSVLLEATRRRAEGRSGPDVLRQHGHDAFVRPCDLDLRQFLALDAAIAAALPREIDLVPLSPIVPLGTCSAVAVGSQNRILSATRNTEVVSDPSNGLALIAAERRAAGVERVRLGTVHRAVRTQRVSGPWLRQHFHLWVLVTAGRDPGGRSFEGEELRRIIGALTTLLQAARKAGHPLPQPSVRMLVRSDLRPVAEAALADWTGPDPTFLDGPASYYDGLRFQMDIPYGDSKLPLIDGGLVDWVGKLRSDRKEKCIVGAVGTELLVRLWPTTGR